MSFVSNTITRLPRKGNWSHFSMRQRYPQMLKAQTAGSHRCRALGCLPGANSIYDKVYGSQGFLTFPTWATSFFPQPWHWAKPFLLQGKCSFLKASECYGQTNLVTRSICVFEKVFRLVVCRQLFSSFLDEQHLKHPSLSSSGSHHQRLLLRALPPQLCLDFCIAVLLVLRV